MADIYVKSGAANSSPYTPWENGAATVALASGIDAPNDNIYVSQSHAESSASTQTIALAGTLAAPVKVLCVNDSAAPPTAEATGAVVEVTGALNNLVFSGAAGLFKGINFRVGAVANQQGGISYSTQDGYLEFVGGSLELLNTSTNSRISFGSSTPVRTTVKTTGTDFRFGSALQFIAPTYSKMTINGGSLIAGSASPNFLFGPTNSELDVTRFDLINAASTINLAGTISTPCSCRYRHMVMPSGWTGNLGSHTTYGARSVLQNYKVGSTWYQLWVSDYAGEIKEDRVVVRTGGQEDGAAYSWRMVSSANASYPAITLDTPEFAKYNTSTSEITATVEIVLNSATALTDGEIWLEVSYPGASGQTVVADAKASILAAAADQASSSVDWTTTGLSTPLKQKLSVTFTPAAAGWLQAKVRLAKASATVYIDPMLTVA